MSAEKEHAPGRGGEEEKIPEDEDEQVVRIILQQAQSTAAELIAYSMSTETAMNAHYLYVRKRLPTFYFTQAANDTGVTPAMYRCWRSSNHSHQAQPNDRKLLLMSEILCRVKLRIHRSPPDETYQGALERLRLRVEEVKDSGITHNKIAQYLRMSYRTLIDITEENSEDKHRPRHCPWELLERLQNAEERINTHAHIKSGDFRDVRTDRNMEPVPPPPDMQFIQRFENCLKCNATWTHLYYDGVEAYGNCVYTCMTCGQHNLIRNPLDEMEDEAPLPVGEGPPREEFIQRYGECRRCNAPWHNMYREGTDRWGHTEFICMQCREVNRVVTKQKDIQAAQNVQRA